MMFNVFEQFVCLYVQLLVKVRPGLPYVVLDSAWKEKIKAVMVKHYNANVKALDLSQFHIDPGERMVICIYNTKLTD
jgi:hypothetical protein